MEANQLIAEVSLPLSMLAACINSGKKIPPVIQIQIIGCMSVSQSASSRKHIAATNHRTVFHQEMQENYQPWILALCSGTPMDMDKPHLIVLSHWNCFFLLFKKRVPLIFENKMSAIQCWMKAYQLISLYTPVKSRWTIPLIDSTAYKTYVCTVHEYIG